MSLNLDIRQRAMLLEMGVRVWQPPAPEAAPAAAPSAPETIAAKPGAASAGGPLGQHLPDWSAGAGAGASTSTPSAAPAPAASGEPVWPPAVPPAGASLPIASSAGIAPSAPFSRQPAHATADAPADALAPWHLGPAQLLYADSSARPGGARWLVLAQTAPAASGAPMFEGEAGRLLDNMLRAARLHQDAGAVLFAPLVRQAAALPTDGFAAALAALVAQARPDVVLVMGRLAAQALLASSEPFGKLRGRVHALHGCPAVVTHDAPYLLRCPQDKAKAWDDLCLAIGLAVRAG